jgi:hypothetical protein
MKAMIYNPDNWKRLLKDLKLEWLRINHSEFFIASGGYSMEVKPYKDTTANGLTNAIEDFIKHIGGYANRISTTGTMRKINGRMQWTKGNSNKGAADVRILFNGRSVDVEIKIGKDRMSEAQVKEQQRVERAGGLYFVAISFPEFLQWWLQQFPLSISSLSNTTSCQSK